MIQNKSILKIYEKLMKKCFSLALQSKGKNIPNPYVGAVVYDEKNDKIISFGYHKLFGASHAEVEAIRKAKNKTKGKTLVVNLEPCSHYGKTPPCADLIIESGFKKVVVGCLDPNPKVSGRGIKKLKEAGIDVITGVLEEQAKELNKVFIKNITTKTPYIMLKTAATLDSRIATKEKKSKWITNDKARAEVQKLRSSYQAIMSASGTILADNPMLNVRIKNKKNPARIIFDPNNKIPLNYNVFNNDKTRIILVNNSDIKVREGIEKIPFEGFLELFQSLYRMGIYSIMVEAGAGFCTQLFKHSLVDEINQFIAPKIFGSGPCFVEGLDTKEIVDCIELEKTKIKKIGDNFLINGRIKKKEVFNENFSN